MVNSQFIEKLSILEKKNSFNNIKNYWSLNYSRTALYVYSSNIIIIIIINNNNEREFQITEQRTTPHHLSFMLL